jgi:MFS family permease
VKSTPRWTLIATILGSSLGFVDATVVNVAIPGISRDLGGGAAAAQWIIAAYLLPLASFVLVGGALSDRFGHRRTFLLGLVGFGIASIACGASQSVAQLVAARAV